MIPAKIAGVLVEIRLRRRLNAIRATTKINRVHVIAQHLALILCLRDLDGQERFSQLAGIRRGFAQIVAFRILLGDGRTALVAVPEMQDHVGKREEGSLKVDPLMLVKAFVLNRDKGVLHMGVHIGDVAPDSLCAA